MTSLCPSDPMTFIKSLANTIFLFYDISDTEPQLGNDLYLFKKTIARIIVSFLYVGVLPVG